MGNFEQAYRALNTAQRQAVDTIEGPVLVIAGPGTGKTQLLSLRAANILRLTDTNPSNILCLTYTESGQQAMRERLQSLLGNQAKKFEIHTFHGFGTHLIGHFSEYFPALSQARPADDLALYEVLLSCLEKLPRSNPLAKMSYGQFVYQADAATRISQLKQAGITPEEAIQKAAQDSNWCATAGRQLAKAFNDTGRLSAKSAGSLQTNLDNVLNDKHGDGLAQSCQQELTAALQASEESGKATALSAFKKKWFVSDDGKLYFKPTDQLKKLVALAELYTAYEAELRQHKLYDYDDMILYALHALETNPEFRSTVQETYQYILADEYQDTNEAQAKIITLIADNPVNEGRPNVMVVGDDDQAIYGFQGAFADVLLHFREHWREVTTITLKDNYRSTQAIIDTARSVIRHGQDRLENYYEDINKSLTARARHANTTPFLVETVSSEAVLHKAVTAAKNTGGFDQLAIIATKHKYLRELADRLDAAKIAYYYEGREDLLKDPTILQLLKLADLGLAIRQKEFSRANYLLPELIATDILKISRETAWAVAVNARLQKISWWEVLSGLKQDDAKRAVDTLTTTAELIDPTHTLNSLQALARQYGFKILRKTRALMKHAEKYFGRQDINLNELLRYADLCLRAGVTLSEKVIKGRVNASVVLLSAHKSKGLEFDRVYLLHADSYTWLKEKGRRNNITLPEGWNHIEPSIESIDDKLRLLYVVMTRAKKELALIRSRAGRQGRPVDNLPGLENLPVTEHISEQLEAFAIAAEQSWQAWYLPQNPTEKIQLQNLLIPVLKDYRLSPSHLTTFLDVPHGGPAAFLTANILGIPEPLHPEALFGNRVHDTLHYAQKRLNDHGQLPAKSGLQKYAQAKHALNDEQAADIVEVVDGFLRNTQILQTGGVGEYNFSDKAIVLDSIKLTGTADHYMLHGQELVVTDFKTGRALNSWRVAEDYYKQKLHRFRQQLLFYELLFRLTPEFTNIPATKLQIAFVEPSQHGAYYQLTLDADNKERSRLQDLMTVVWQKITDVDFPETSSYGLDAAGVLAFEDDLINGRI